jgi:catechol-2,3-dioxygenase
MSPPMKSIDHGHVWVVDRTAAEHWYEKVLGLVRIKEPAFWPPSGGPLTIQNCEGTVRLALFEGTPEKRPSTIAFGVDANAFMKWQPHLGDVLGMQLQAVDNTVSWSLYFTNPDGNRFEITSYAYQTIERELAKRDA